MSAGTQDHRYDAILPARVEARLLCVGARSSGYLLFALTAFLWVSLLTWSVTDPSLTHPADTSTGNAAGPLGAILSELLLQTLGLGAVVCLLAPMIWGLELIYHERVIFFRTKAIFYPLSILLLAGALSTLPVAPAWPLHYDMGGILGDFVSDVAPRSATFLTGVVLFTAGFATLASSIGGDLGGILTIAWARPPRGTVTKLWHPSIPSDATSSPVNPQTKARERHESLSPAPQHRHDNESEDNDDLVAGPEPAGYPSTRAIAIRFTPYADRDPANPDMDVPLPDPEVPLPWAAPGVGHFGSETPDASNCPPLNILKRPAAGPPGVDVSHAAIHATGQRLVDVLADYGVQGELRDVKPGPVVTLYEFEPMRGTKSARVIALANDIARSMSVMSVRVVVDPDRNGIGLELPNAKRVPVLLRDMLESESFRSSKAILPVALGKSIGGDAIIADLARMPHLLVAGTAGSGKSVGINAMILSLLYRHTPEECRFIMIDPNMIELSVYYDIPHLLTPVVTDPHKAVATLGWAVTEMEERYKRMAALSVRNIEAFNQRVKAASERGETLTRTVQTGFDRATGQPRFETQEIDARPMPYIVVVVDEFADLMIVAGREIEQAVQRLAQMARAAGIHLIMATQRSSVEIITVAIKSSFPTRVSFKVTSKTDSRMILNEQGAEQLLGQGDMLFSTGAGPTTRVHSPFVSNEVVELVLASSNQRRAQIRYSAARLQAN